MGGAGGSKAAKALEGAACVGVLLEEEEEEEKKDEVHWLER